MNRQLIISAIVFCLLTPSCRVLNQRVDFSWFSDTLTAPQSDSAFVESGRGLPASAAPAEPATTVASAQEDLVATPPTVDPLPQPAPAVAEAEPPAAPAAPETPKVAPQPAAKPLAAPAAKAVARTHTVAKGDTLAAIARRYHSSVPAIAAANGNVNPNALKIGTVLNIPSGTGAAAAAAHAPKLATATAPAARRAAAPAAPKRSFWQFWKKAPAAPRPSAYLVQKGDTLNAIAHRHGVTPSALMSANGLNKDSANRLSIGQKLLIPTPKK